MIWFLLVFAVIGVGEGLQTEECASGDDDVCNRHWPGAMCIEGKCECPSTHLKRNTKSGWVCMNLFDASTGSFGPPLTCPLPSGQGFKAVACNGTDVQFCSTEEDHCPADYECIEALNFTPVIHETGMDGVCCPTKRLACSQPPVSGPKPTLVRWFFNANQCIEFMWDLFTIEGQTANNFETKEHCESYCM